jgi:membrane-associated PAP2 superfamily phosphatase
VHAFRHEAWKHLRLPLLYLLLAAALGSTAVSLLKSITHVDCPWDLLRYGGTRAMPTSLFAAQPPGTPSGACFPAGHASAGYAWVALYFAALLGCRRWRWHGLAIGLGSGLLFGAGQQLRGAHFLSHDLGSLAVCWSLSLALYCVFVWRTGCAPTQLPSEPAEANA